MTRALFLLWKAIHHFEGWFRMPFQNIGQINQVTAERVLKNYIYKACCLNESNRGGNTGANHVLTQIFPPNPLMFLQDNKVIFAGSGHLSIGSRNVLACTFEYDATHDRYKFVVLGNAGNGAVNVQVESVTAFHWTHQRYVPRAPGVPAPPGGPR